MQAGKSSFRDTRSRRTSKKFTTPERRESLGSGSFRWSRWDTAGLASDSARRDRLWVSGSGMELQNDPLIAYATGDVLTVKILQQGDCIFPAYAREFLEFGNVDLGHTRGG